MCCENSKGPENFSVWDSEAYWSSSKVNVATFLLDTACPPVPTHIQSIFFHLREHAPTTGRGLAKESSEAVMLLFRTIPQLLINVTT